MKKIMVLMVLTLVVTAAHVFAGGGSESRAAAEDRSLIVYTNSGSDGRGDWLTEVAAEAGFDVTVVHMTGGDLANRIIAERNAQIADVVWGLNALEYERIKTYDLLLQYTPSWASEVDMVLGDPEGYYHPIVVQPLMLAYNRDFISPADAPRDWTELGSRFPGQYNIFGLGSGTSRSILSSILVRYADPNGELGVSQAGWDAVENYLQNAHYIQSGEDYWASVVNGTRPMTMIWGSGLLLNQRNLNQTFEIMQPEVGHPFVVEQLAIFRNSNKTAVAQEFVDWMGSADIQARFAQEFGTTPAHPVALQASPQEVRDLMGNVRPQSIDWQQVSLRLADWVEKAELEFVP